MEIISKKIILPADVVTVQKKTTALVVGTGTGGEVNIIDQESNVIDTITAPADYPVLVFSGISGGNSTTSYTNSIVAQP